jgi:hypothetical protein
VHKRWKTRNTRNIVEGQRFKVQHDPQQRATVPATIGRAEAKHKHANGETPTFYHVAPEVDLRRQTIFKPAPTEPNF